MGKYSSDSENEKRCSKNPSKSSRSRRRSSSSDSFDSKNRRRRDKKSSRKSRSRSRDRYSRNRRSRSRSTSYKSSKSRSRRSTSRDRYRYRRTKSRSRSRDRYRSRRSRSRSKDYIKEYVSKPKRRSSSNSSSSSDNNPKTITKVRKESTVKDNGKIVKQESPDCVIIDSEILDEINDNSFAPKQFTSGKSKKVPENIVIDLKKNTIKVPEIEQVEPDSIFHHSLFLNEESRMDKWVRELYSFRQKALQQGSKNDR